MEKKTALLVLALVFFGSTVAAQESAQSDQTQAQESAQSDQTQTQESALSVPKTDIITELAFATEDEFGATLFDDNFNNYLLNPRFGNEPPVSTDPANDQQTSKNRANLQKLLFSSGLLFVSGFSDATSEVLKIKYESFERVFPNANDQFWNYNISWTNKYRNGSPPDARFIGSKTALVWTTDGYHLMRMIRNCTMIVAVTIPIKSGFQRHWKSYVMDGVIYYLSYTAGFNLAYDVVFK